MKSAVVRHSETGEVLFGTGGAEERRLYAVSLALMVLGLYILTQEEEKELVITSAIREVNLGKELEGSSPFTHALRDSALTVLDLIFLSRYLKFAGDDTIKNLYDACLRFLSSQGD